MPGKSVLIVIATLALSGVAAALRPPEPASAPAASSPATAATSVTQFDARWSAAPEMLPLKKEDRLPLLPPLAPLSVKAEPVVLAQAPVAAKPAAAKKSGRGGICAKGKIWFKNRGGWRSWRCRR
jgi:hypothetical protein